LGVAVFVCDREHDARRVEFLTEFLYQQGALNDGRYGAMGRRDREKDELSGALNIALPRACRGLGSESKKRLRAKHQ